MKASTELFVPLPAVCLFMLAACTSTTTPPPATAQAADAVDVEAAYGRALMLAEAGDLDDAARLFDEVLEATGGELFEAAYNAGVVRERQGQSSEAGAAYGKALAIRPDSAVAFTALARLKVRAGHLDQALTLAEAQLEHHSGDEVELLLANLLVDAGRHREAMDRARRVLARADRNVAAYLVVARVQLALGRDEAALSITETALDVARDSAAAYNLLGQVQLARGEQQAATMAFERAVEQDPASARARNNYGVQLLETGRPNQAVRQLRIAGDLDPSWATVHLNLGDAHRRAGEWSEALSALERALELDGNLHEAHYDLGLLYLEATAELGGLDRAARLRRAIEELERYKTATATGADADSTIDDILAEARSALH